MDRILKDKRAGYICFGIVFLALFAGRISLLGQGHLDDTDELPFLLLLRNYDKLLSFDVDAWNDQVFVMWSTYLETLYRLPQVFFLKVYVNQTGLPLESTQALSVIGFFNVLTAMAISFVFYKILLRLSFDRVLALLGVLMLASFLNSNLYIRHIISYDSSFLIHLTALYVLLKAKLSAKDYILAGILSAIGYFDYYGYFMMFLIVWIIGMYRLEIRNVKNVVLHTFYLAFPSFALLLFFQGISMLSGQSYVDFLLLFSTTIFHGSPDETLQYAYKYLSIVEGNWGLFMFFLAILGLLYMFFYGKSYSPKVKVFFASGLSAYLLYGIYAVLTQEMVLYGRVFHMYLPFLVIAVLFVVAKHRKLMPVFYLSTVIAFIFSITELRSIGYPRSTVYQLGLFDENSRHRFVHEMKPGIEYNFKKPHFDGVEMDIPIFYLPKTNQKSEFQGDLILKNFGFYFHYPDTFTDDYHPIPAPEGYEKVFTKIHFMSHPAYIFEYCTRYGREFFIDKQLELAIYQKRKE